VCRCPQDSGLVCIAFVVKLQATSVAYVNVREMNEVENDRRLEKNK
jgi:hypothetical protein